jgi:hypothetical protein
MYGTRRQPSTERCVSERKHQRDKPGRHAQLDDHDSIERPDEQHRRHAHRHLEEREAQEAGHRELRRAGIGEGQDVRPDAHQAFDESGAGAVHDRRASTACEM